MMATGAFGKRFSGWMKALGILSAGIVFGLSTLSPALAAPAKKKPAATKAAAKPSAKSSAKAPAAKSGARAAARQAPARAGAGKGRGASGARAVAQQSRRGASQAAAKRGPRAGATVAQRSGRVAARETRLSLQQATPEARPARLSFGQMAGLHAVNDPLDLKSSVALVVDQDTHEVLLSKNDHAVLPIASLTKLMTGLIVSDARLPLDEMITITEADIDTEKGSRSRLSVGTTLSRGELMHLALMSSENRAAHALGRTYPGGMDRFVALMNTRAARLGMKDTRYVEPTGLSSGNRSSAHDLATLVAAAADDRLLRQLTTSHGYEVALGERMLQYNNTNRLVHNPEWQIGLQKTGYISEAGQCLVMQARVAGRKLIMVFLDSSGRGSRLGDAERVRRWVETQRPAEVMAATGAFAS
jgi:D-alanyl-D-alanine endopeptidase (penicillin-binding protein 7)